MRLSGAKGRKREKEREERRKRRKKVETWSKGMKKGSRKSVDR
jgi:hypothetical protein